LKIKKLLTTLASAALWAILVAVCLCSLSVEANAATESDLTFTLNEDGASYSVTDCNTKATGKLTIPATYNGKPVTAIGYGAFRYCKLTGITIPDSVTRMDYHAFENCDNLKTISIPDSITSMEAYSFTSCDNLTYTVYNNAKYLGNENNPYVVLVDATSYDITSCKIHTKTKIVYGQSFTNCTKLASITIPNSVTYIGQSAFENCTGLNRVSIGNNVKHIRDWAFYSCSSLTSITIPSGITNIDDAFDYCDNLTYTVYSNAKYLGNSNNPYVVLMDTVSDDITSCEIHAKTRFVYEEAFDYCANLETITIPDSVISIGYEAFENCTGLKSATIGSSVTSIGGAAFYGCSSLTGITIPDGVTSIGASMFAWCSSLTEVILPDGVTSIGASMFKRCSSLTEVILPDSVTRIDTAAFYGCRLTSITIPNSVTSIGNEAFYDCYKLESLSLPDGVTSIGEKAFSSCDNLKSISIPDSITTIGPGAFEYCSSLIYHVYDNAKYLGNDKNHYVVLIELVSQDITSCIIHTETRVISESAFAGCVNLNSISIPDSVTYLDKYVFKNCTGLQSATIGNGAAGIGYSAFEGCTGLKSVTLGNSLTQIENRAFYNCGNLTDINIPDGVTSIGREAFYHCESLTSVTIPDSVKSIGMEAFYHCESLTSITIPDSVTSIGDHIFDGCASLKSAVIGNGVSQIGYYAFGYCGSLTSVTIGSGVKAIDSWAFEHCGSLPKISIPKSVTDISSAAFDYCYSLMAINVNKNNPNYSSVSGALFNKAKTELLRVPGGFLGAYTVPDSVTTIGNWAFRDCIHLTGVTVPKSVTLLTGSAFDGCSSLKQIIVNKNNPNYSSISGVLFNKEQTKLIRVPGGKSGTYTVPDGVSALGDYGEHAFQDCALLTEVIIPESVGQLHSYLFSGCTQLQKVTIPNSTLQISEFVFEGCENLQFTVYGNAKYLGNAQNPYHALISGVSKDIKTCTIHSKTKTIANEAFLEYSNLSGITIPGNVNRVGNRAFQYSGLTSLTITEGVQEILSDAFRGCTGLTKLVIPNGVVLDGSTFRNCSNLKKIFFYSIYLPYWGGSLPIFYGVTATAYSPVNNPNAGSHWGDGLTWKSWTPFKLISQPKSAYAIVGDTAKVTVKAAGDGLKYQWYYKDAGSYEYSLSSVNNATYSCKLNEKTNGRYLKCKVTDQYGNSVWTKEVRMQIKDLAITAQPVSKTVKKGATAKFTVTPNGTTVTFQWQFRTSAKAAWKNTAATGSKTKTLSVPATAARNGYQYRCRIKDSEGNIVYSNAVTLSVMAIKKQPVNKAVVAGKTAKFTVSVTGKSLRYQWQFRTSAKAAWKNTTATGSKTKTLSVSATAARNGYQYRCRVTDSDGNILYSKTVTLHVLAIKTQPVSKAVVAGKTAKFTVSAVGKGLRYQWQYRASAKAAWKNTTATGSKTKTLSVPAAAAKNGYQYRCRITDSTGNVLYSNTVTLKVK